MEIMQMEIDPDPETTGDGCRSGPQTEALSG